ncbi:uncharacterized protein Z520_05245 [Fonsecaea multimorphosa CBS 102226]|uniref:Uncharacterized protein n=1 Tax=Fonsecaea multimorphosa CBS 102226 TaxID=1442371 RepID=A0A0D2K6I1_9EURO|nr:uncharacterized protein Z520_05245 [Fonsecaea multimorphosa CBS 102226]KIX98784.1 hypothetical protein Z520_05245 [Fonsecaea multimorphosa CBS 102226]
MREKQKLLESLNLLGTSNARTGDKRRAGPGEPRKPSAKRRRRGITSSSSPSPADLKTPSTRTSARIAARGGGHGIYTYTEDTKGPVGDVESAMDGGSSRKSRNRSNNNSNRKARTSDDDRPRREGTQSNSRVSKPMLSSLPTSLPSLLQHYNSWTASAPLPTQDALTQRYHFASHPLFVPNKSPLSILQEGAFGASFFSPWRSRTLSPLTLVDDHLSTLPATWLAQLSPPEKYITSARYDASLNRHGVAAGQTLAQWEDAGWIDFRHDARGWFEWYIRFWLGRRLDDGEDERQVGRWVRCVGPKGRWKRMLLKKYVDMGVRSVFDDEDDDNDNDDDDGDGDRKVSPVMHQTCLQWGYQVTQEDLDDAWRERRGAG